MFAKKRFTRSGLLATAALCLTAPVLLGEKPASEANDTTLEEAAFEALAAGRVELAERLFRRALDHSPRSAPAHAGFGMIEMRRRDFLAAEEWLEKAVRLDPADDVIAQALKDARYWARLKQGDAARAQGLEDKARRFYEQAAQFRVDGVELNQRLPRAGQSAAANAQAAKVSEPAARKAGVPVRKKTRSSAAAQAVSSSPTEGVKKWATLRPLARRARTAPLSAIEAATLTAAVHADRGAPRDGLRELASTPTPARDRTLSRAWEVQRVRLLILSDPRSPQTYRLLKETSGRPGLTRAEIADYRELWVLWSLGWAEETAARGDPERALKLLERSRSAYPADARLTTASARIQKRIFERRRAYSGPPRPGRVIIHGLDDPQVAVDRRRRRPAPSLAGRIRVAGG